MAAGGLTSVRWYFDESVLGAAKHLARSCSDITYPGHHLVPDLPLGVTDPHWMAVVAARNWVAVTRDRRIRSRPGELDILRESGLRVVWFTGKKDLRPGEQAELFVRHLTRLEQQIIKLGAGPWGLSLSQAGVRPIMLR